VDAWLSFYSDDVAVLAPNEKATTGKAAARKAIESLLGLPGLKIKWENSNGVASASGDLAVLYGRYEMSFEDGKKTVSDSGNTLEVWKKQADGSWKCVVDTWNSDVPLAPPAK
jgi:ketosteroid isomerase-like protein